MLAINRYCPHSGKPISADSLTLHRGFTIGFCNPGCRDDFAASPEDFPKDLGYFDAIIKEHALSVYPPPVGSKPQIDSQAALVLIDFQVIP